MRTTLIIAIAVSLPLFACGKGGADGWKSSEAVGKAFVSAVNDQDKGAIAALYPSDELLKASLECQDPKTYERVAKQREGLAKELDDDLKGAKLEFLGAKDSRENKIAAGQDKDGCKATVDVVTMRSKWGFKITKDGKSGDEGEGVTVVKFGQGGWFLMRM